MTLLVSGSTGKVVYGEVGPDFVQHWTTLLHKPLGEVLSELRTGPSSPLGGMYRSLEAIPDSFFTVSKAELLKPSAGSNTRSSRALLPSSGPAAPQPAQPAPIATVKETVRFMLTGTLPTISPCPWEQC